MLWIIGPYWNVSLRSSSEGILDIFVQDKTVVIVSSSRVGYRWFEEFGGWHVNVKERGNEVWFKSINFLFIFIGNRNYSFPNFPFLNLRPFYTVTFRFRFHRTRQRNMIKKIYKYNINMIHIIYKNILLQFSYNNLSLNILH